MRFCRQASQKNTCYYSHHIFEYEGLIESYFFQKKGQGNSNHRPHVLTKLFSFLTNVLTKLINIAILPLNCDIPCMLLIGMCKKKKNSLN